MRARRADSLSGSKIKSAQELKKVSFSLRAMGKKIVFTNGCFDLLHYGHVKYLEDAKKKGDVLVVGVNSDSSLRRIKGAGRPVVNGKDRIRTIAGLESVDYAVLFSEDTPLRIIKLVRPDILVKGADWDKSNIVGADFVSNYGGRVSTVKLVEGRSTTGIIKKIAKSL